MVPCVGSFTSDQILALEHVLSLDQSEGGVLDIASVNMSLGGALLWILRRRHTSSYLGYK